MHLKKLEIIGFKSFAEKTELVFEPGIAAIVGPNGCGKSNIFDSIRWVLGEQSVKALRGSDMQDVIFNGTDTAQPLNVAEVSLTFANDERIFPVDADEVMVTRRIYRSGESQYLLNKAEVRLKDILETFMGTGIGAEAYSLVEQGKIDLILSSRPEDRRLVFDEASGITKYKAQKKEALRRLEETENNLLRINDIITEVKRQIGSLERQANKARRYKEILEELKAKEIVLACFTITDIKREHDQLLQEINDFERVQTEKNALIQDLEAKLIQALEELKSQEHKINEIRTEIQNLENLWQRNTDIIRLDEERLTDLESRSRMLVISMEQLKQRLVVDENKLNAFRAEYEALESIIGGKLETLRSKEAELEHLSQRIRQDGEGIASSKLRILELSSEQARVKNELVDASTRIQTCLVRKKRLDIDKAKTEEEKASIESTLSSVDQELINLKISSDDMGGQIATSAQELDAVSKALLEIIENVRDLENVKVSLQSQKEFVEKLILRYQDIGESMNAVVLVDNLPQDKVTGLIIKVKAQDPSKDADAGLLAGAKFRFEGEAKSVNLDLEAIQTKLHEVEQGIIETHAIRGEKEKYIDELDTKIKGLEEVHRKLQFQVSNKSVEKDSIEKQLARIFDERKVIDADLSDLQNELQGLEGTQHTLEQRLSEVENGRKELESSIASAQEAIDAHNRSRESAVVSIAQIKTELDSLRSRKEKEVATLTVLQQAFEQDKSDLGKQESEAAEVEEKKLGIRQQIERMLSDNQGYAVRKAQQQEVLRDSESAYQKIQSVYDVESASLEAVKKELDAIKNDVYQHRIQEQELHFKISSIKDRIMQVYKVNLDENPPAVIEQQDPLALARETQALKEKLDSYGNVNLVAIDEYDELRKRYDFLTQQQADLITAKASLSEAISKINRTTKQLFIETFEKVCEEFKNYFRLLFNGGDAKLFLVDESDPLESGIEIIARPPGKKLQNVLLLSGGEKSMTAVALLFAIFKVKPVSFCILEEVDAALDEGNVDRFGRMLHDFAKTSQFILITHNKKTIANANVMYGITMEKTGISRIVSVKFSHTHHAQKPQEPEPEPV